MAGVFVQVLMDRFMILRLPLTTLTSESIVLMKITVCGSMMSLLGAYRIDGFLSVFAAIVFSSAKRETRPASLQLFRRVRAETHYDVTLLHACEYGRRMP